MQFLLTTHESLRRVKQTYLPTNKSSGGVSTANYPGSHAWKWRPFLSKQPSADHVPVLFSTKLCLYPERVDRSVLYHSTIPASCGAAGRCNSSNRGSSHASSRYSSSRVNSNRGGRQRRGGGCRDNAGNIHIPTRTVGYPLEVWEDSVALASETSAARFRTERVHSGSVVSARTGVIAR